MKLLETRAQWGLATRSSTCVSESIQSDRDSSPRRKHLPNSDQVATLFGHGASKEEHADMSRLFFDLVQYPSSGERKCLNGSSSAMLNLSEKDRIKVRTVES